jgi:hypothetical protein
VTLDTLQNRNKHYILIDKIRKEIKMLEDLRWAVFFNWAKAHGGIQGNEMTDSLAKKAAMEDKEEIVYEKETIIIEEMQNGITRLQEQWTSSTKGALSKLFFPHIKERLKITLPISAEFTAMVTGHGLTRSYLHRFKIIPNSTCPCRLKEEQTINHIILNCTQLENQRSTLHKAIVRAVDT